MSRRRLLVAAALSVVAAVPLMSGCNARFAEYIDINKEGGGTLSLELRLDPGAQQAIDLPRQLQEGTFERFLDVRNEKWRAPGDPGSPFLQRTLADGTVVLSTVRNLRAGVSGSSPLSDLERALGVQRPIQPILAATGRYWAAPNPRDAAKAQTTTTPSSGITPGGETQAGITGLPPRVPLQSLLVDDFTPARTEKGRSYFATFSIGSRGGVGEVLDPTCNASSRRVEFTRADLALQKGLRFAYTWAMPARIALYSTDARISGDGYVASWAMPYGECLRMEVSSAGAEDGRVVNGIILGGAILFLALVFALRVVTRRRRRKREMPAEDE